jgi:DNA-binding beta-propeller fold protein YncE
MTLKPKWIYAWAVLRLPLLALILYFLRAPLLQIYESSVGLLGRMDFFVFIASAFSTRLLLSVAAMLALGFGFRLADLLPLSTASKYFVKLAGAGLGIFLTFQFAFQVSNAFLQTTALVFFLALNSLPYEWVFARTKPGFAADLLFLAGVGLAEGLTPQAYILWLMNHSRAGETAKKWVWMSGVVIASFYWLFLLVPADNSRVFTLSETLHANPAVEKFSTGNYNWIELNPQHGLLYAVGRGTNFLLAFDLNHLDAPPRRSKLDIGKTQSFAFNPDRQEIYVYQAWTQELLYFDALTLETFKSVPVPDLSPGDIWLQWDRLTDTLVLSSEADAFIGTPLYLFDRESGDILATLPFPVFPTNLTLHPSKPTLYFNSFRDVYFAAWDMQTYEITRQVTLPPRTDRLIVSEKTNEVWVASPLDGEILRHDADTLAYTGSIETTLGDRTMTLDPERNLLLVGNFMNNRLTVMNLETRKTVARYSLGPWIRTIALDVENGTAYVSTLRGLFRVEYAEPLR